MQFSETHITRLIDLKNLSRILAEIEWLSLSLVLFYYSVPTFYVANEELLLGSIFVFTIFIILYRYTGILPKESAWKLVIESWAMIIFITVICIQTGGINSPLLNLYLLVIISGSLTLNKQIVFLEFILITSVYIYMGHNLYSSNFFSINEFSSFMLKYAPFALVMYITTMLGADIDNSARILRVMSDTDDITGVKSQNVFKQLANQYASRADRYSRNYSIMVVEPYKFKEVHARYGRQARNRLMESLAAALTTEVRDTDILARINDEQFIILLPETDGFHAMELSKRIRKASQNTSFNIKGGYISCEANIGIACFPGDASNIDDLIKIASDLLNQNKQEES